MAMTVAVKSSLLSWFQRHSRPMSAGSMPGSGTSRQYSPVKSGVCSRPYLRNSSSATASAATQATMMATM